MTKQKLSMKLPDIDKPRLAHTRHKITKKEIEQYYEKEGIEELLEEE